MTATERYLQLLEPGNWSDVQAHLPALFEAARGNVLELGVRAGISTTALLAGVEAHGGHVWSVDKDDCSAVWAGHPQWTFVQADSLDAQTIGHAIGWPHTTYYNDLSCIFIDTEHTEERTIAELRLWGPRLKRGGVILLHDTDDGSTYPGVRNAMGTYCAERGLKAEYREGSYGLGVIRC